MYRCNSLDTKFLNFGTIGLVKILKGFIVCKCKTMDCGLVALLLMGGKYFILVSNLLKIIINGTPKAVWAVDTKKDVTCQQNLDV